MDDTLEDILNEDDSGDEFLDELTNWTAGYEVRNTLCFILAGRVFVQFRLQL